MNDKELLNKLLKHKKIHDYHTRRMESASIYQLVSDLVEPTKESLLTFLEGFVSEPGETLVTSDLGFLSNSGAISYEKVYELLIQLFIDGDLEFVKVIMDDYEPLELEFKVKNILL